MNAPVFKVGDFVYDLIGDQTLRVIGTAYGAYQVERGDGFWTTRDAKDLRALTPEERAQVIENPTDEQLSQKGECNEQLRTYPY